MSDGALVRIARGASIVIAGFFVAAALGYAQKLVLAHHLPPGGFGRIALALAVVGFAVNIATLGFREGVTRFLARHREDAATVRGTLRGALLIAVPASVALGGLVYALADVIAVTAFRDPFMGDVLRYIAPLVPLQVVTQLAVAAFRGFQLARLKVIVADVLQPVVVILALLAALVTGRGAVGGAAAYTVGGLATAAVAGTLLVTRSHPAMRAPRAPAAHVMRPLVSFSWPLALTSTLWLVVAWTDVAMLGIFRPTHEVGVYGVALPTAQLLLIFLNALNFLFMPNLTALARDSNFAEARATFRHVTRWVFLTAFPAWVVLVTVAEAFVTAFFGPAYAAAAGPLRVLATGFLVAAVVGPTGSALVALGHPRLNLAFAATAAGLNVVLNLALVPRHGPMGAAWATAASVGVANVVSAALLWRVLHAHPVQRALAAPGAAALAALVVPVGVLTVVPAPGVAGVVLTILAYGVAYAGALVLFRALQPEDLDVLDDLAGHVPALRAPVASLTTRLRRRAGA